MSVQNENATSAEGVTLEHPQAGGVYASLFEKINLHPVSSLSALDIWQDAQAITALDSSRMQLVWMTPNGNPLKFIMRSELGDGPLALLKLHGFRLPESIFSVVADSTDKAFTATEGQ